MQIHDIKPNPGSKHRKKRLGSGEASGKGKTSGKGHKGQKARSGGSIRIGFEGGQMPLIRRLPKRGFNNSNFKTIYAPINLCSLEVFNDGDVIDEATLRAKRLVNGNWNGIKLLAKGDLTKKLTIKVQAASATAKDKIQKLGGKIEILPVKHSRSVAKSKEESAS